MWVNSGAINRIQSKFILCGTCDPSHNFQFLYFLFKSLIYKQVEERGLSLLDAEINSPQSIPGCRIVCPQFYHLNQIV